MATECEWLPDLAARELAKLRRAPEEGRGEISGKDADVRLPL